MGFPRTLGALALASSLTLLHCGARPDLSFEPDASVVPAGGGAAVPVPIPVPANAADAAPADDCDDDAGVVDCPDASASPNPIDPYARLRTACGSSVTVNRRGPSTAICHHIK